jgi:6-pyruvoyltetrahydropterin/6-carboxytetrahydropterin synthase
MYSLKVKAHFDAAHKLNDYVGACANLHGHRWDVIFEFTSNALNECGMMIDFKTIKPIINEILPDHKYLNDIVDFNPTAENLSKYIYDETKNKLPEYIKLISVELFESPDCSCIYKED